MMRRPKRLSGFHVLLTMAAVLLWLCKITPAAENPKKVLLIYHVGDPTRRGSPPIEAPETDALTHATTRRVNVEIVAQELQRRFAETGISCDLRKADDIHDPRDLLAYDGILIGTPVWFSNMAYPIKRFFDIHMIRLYEHRPNRLKDRVMSGFCVVMEGGESGPRALQALMWGIGHMTDRTVNGLVVRTSMAASEWQPAAQEFARRFAEALGQP